MHQELQPALVTGPEAGYAPVVHADVLVEFALTQTGMVRHVIGDAAAAAP